MLKVIVYLSLFAIGLFPDSKNSIDIVDKKVRIKEIVVIEGVSEFTPYVTDSHENTVLLIDQNSSTVIIFDIVSKNVLTIKVRSLPGMAKAALQNAKLLNPKMSVIIQTKNPKRVTLLSFSGRVIDSYYDVYGTINYDCLENRIYMVPFVYSLNKALKECIIYVFNTTGKLEFKVPSSEIMIKSKDNVQFYDPLVFDEKIALCEMYSKNIYIYKYSSKKAKLSKILDMKKILSGMFQEGNSDVNILDMAGSTNHLSCIVANKKGDAAYFISCDIETLNWVKAKLPVSMLKHIKVRHFITEDKGRVNALYFQLDNGDVGFQKMEISE